MRSRGPLGIIRRTRKVGSRWRSRQRSSWALTTTDAPRFHNTLVSGESLNRHEVILEAAMNYKFVMVDHASGSDRVRWILKPPLVVGRCPTTDICIADPSISRRHCEFSTNSEGALVVRDLGSTNGIYLNDQRVEKAIVLSGTEVRLGAITLRADLTEEAADKPLPFSTYEVDATQRMKLVRVQEDR
jgi:hypothetical protein